MKGSEYQEGMPVTKRNPHSDKRVRHGVTVGQAFQQAGRRGLYCEVKWDDSGLTETVSIHMLQTIVYKPQGDIAV